MEGGLELATLVGVAFHVASDELRGACRGDDYNNEKHICNAVQSVFERTEQSIEIIVVDDGSTDNSLERLQEF